MTFDELDLLVCVWKTRKRIRDNWTQAQRLSFAIQVASEYAEHSGDTVFKWSVDEVWNKAMQLRKSKAYRCKAEVAVLHGNRCFWRNRDVGECCNDVELGHIVSNSSGGPVSVRNCMIECRTHNNQRRDSTIEQYIAGFEKRNSE